jgi:hypothetical protein
LPNNSTSNNSVSESVKCAENVQMRFKPRSKLFGANVRIVKSRDQKSKFPANQMFPAVFDCNAELDELLKSSSNCKRPQTYENLTRLRPKPLPI